MTAAPSTATARGAGRKLRAFFVAAVLAPGRRGAIALFVLAAAMLLSAGVDAQLYGRRSRSPLRGPIEDNHPPPSELIVSRWHFGTNGLIGHMGWSHNYPESEINLNEFVGRTTRVQVETRSYRLLELSSPEIFEYPFAYISEPGEMEMSENEVANLREYIDRGGFVLIDDFDGDHMDNLREEMHRVFADRHFERLEIENPIFDLVFKVRDLQSMGDYVQGGDPVYYGLRNDVGEIAVVALHNNDLANFWEWYGSPQYPLQPATEAFRLGTNFVVHAFTH
jgi:hypothetical protein